VKLIPKSKALECGLAFVVVHGINAQQIAALTMPVQRFPEVGSEFGIIGTFGMSQVALAITEKLAGEGVDPIAEVSCILPSI